jgi:hypothetical protein
MQPSRRVESVARHEIGHAIDQNMGYFSHNNKPFVNAYNKEKSTLPKNVRTSLKYILQKGNDGLEEAFSEFFAISNGGAASGPAAQKLMENYFPKSLAIVKKAMGSLH